MVRDSRRLGRQFHATGRLGFGSADPGYLLRVSLGASEIAKHLRIVAAGIYRVLGGA